MKRIFASASLVVALFLAFGSPASADSGTSTGGSEVSPASLCSGSYTFFKTNNTGIQFTQASQPNSSVTGGPGVTLSISTSTTFTVSGTVSASAEVSTSAIFASVSATMGVSITNSKSGTTTNSGSWTVPSNWNIGRLAIGAMKYKGTVTKYLENKDCVDVQVGSSASYNAPQNEWHFQTSKVS